MGLFGSVVHVPGIAPPVGEAAGIDMLQVTKRFGAFTALDGVSLSVAPGSFHALLGENGAGKSTLVKCLIGYQPADSGSLMVDGREQKIASPREAADLGIGMVFQHFTLAPNLTVAENLLLAQPRLPAVLDWKRERAALESMLADMPFKVPLGVLAGELAAGEKQKVEILKQLYLRRRFIILDEPTSVLTPGEADELLGFLKQRTQAGKLSVLMITHKFREVMAFADDVTVLRRGRRVGGTKVADTDPHQLSVWMMGADESVEAPAANAVTNDAAAGEEVLVLDALSVIGDQGLPAVQDVGLRVRAGEIVGVAGVSGNGQRELVEALLGQRRVVQGRIRIGGRDFHHRRGEIRALGVRSLPEEPLRNACVAEMSVAENMALRSFDRPPLARGPWLRSGELARQAAEMISAFNVRTPSPDAPIAALSGGNVQRAVLARELSAGEGAVKLLIVANPVFGLDFRAVAAIHARISAARDAGCAVLLVSEDLDELLELSDRIVVMHAGRLVYECPRGAADVATLGHYMAGEAHAA